MKILSFAAYEEQQFLFRIQEKAVEKVLSDYAAHIGHVLSFEERNRVNPIFELLHSRFITGLNTSYCLAEKSFRGFRFDPKRISYYNADLDANKQALLSLFPKAAGLWVLDGLVFQNQVAGLKNLAGFTGQEGIIIDVLNSASSLSLGAENPWLVKMDIIEDLLGVRDNICAAYHPGMRQGFALKKLAELYPNKSVKELSVHAESSGTIVNSIAVESVVAFAEQQNSDQAYKKVLAIDGTWAGGYGTTREGTGFGVDDYQVKRAGRSLWMERCLPPPTKENTKIFLDILQHKLNESGVAGIYIEPDVIGDLGLVSFNQKLLREVKQLMLNHNLPIIADCVQQLGRTGSYWGENVDTILSDYPLLVVTTAKSASNGQPFGFTIMPKVIADAASPLSQITTNQMNGPLLRSLVVAEILRNSELQSWLRVKARDIEAIAGSYQLSLDDGGLRGKFLNRGIYLDNNDQVKLAQIALLVEDGLLVGATPSSIRYQPMLLEYSETNRLLSKVIFRRIDMVKSGNISTEVQDIFTKMQEIPSGLARKNF